MKNIFKKIQFLLLAAVMTVTCFGTTAFAAEEMQVNDAPILEFEITSDAEEGVIAVPAAVINQTFNMTTSHRGADRTYSGTTLAYGVTITDADGNPVSDVVAVGLHDYNNATAIHTSVNDADGSFNYYTVPIVANRMYYFRYTKVSGTTSVLRVNMQINSF